MTRRHLAASALLVALVLGRAQPTPAQTFSFEFQHPVPQGNQLYTIHYEPAPPGRGTATLSAGGGAGAYVRASVNGFFATYDPIQFGTELFGDMTSLSSSNGTMYHFYESGWSDLTLDLVPSGATQGRVWYESGTDSQYGFAIGTNGNLYFCPDIDGMWTLAYSGSSPLISLEVLADGTVWAFGEDGLIVKSTDAGLSWDDRSAPTGLPIHDLTWTTGTGNDAVVVGGGGTVLQTTDEGSSWGLRPTGFSETLRCVATLGGVTLALGDDGAATRSTDDGFSWSTPFYFGLRYNWSAITTGDNLFWFAGSGGALAYAFNEATGYGDITHNDPHSDVLDMDFFDKNEGIAVTADSIILKTTNGGGTWRDSDLFTYWAIRTVALGGTNTIVAGGAFGNIFVSTDRGASWTFPVFPEFLEIQDIYMINAFIGFAVGDLGTYGTTNGGLTWSFTSTSRAAAPTDLFCAYFSDANTGIVGGAAGAIHRTTDAGATWAQLATTATGTVREFHFPTALTGFAVGDTGEIQKTTDGGLTWSLSTLPGGENLKSVHFPSATVGYAVGAGTGAVFGFDGTLQKTTDGGSTWNEKIATSTASMLLHAVHFLDEDNGFIGGDGGAILKTSTGATTAVRLSALHAAPILGTRNVEVTWQTSTETRHDGFHVYRATSVDGPWERQTTDLIRGRSPYRWVDRRLTSAGTWFYRIGAVDRSAHEVMYGPIAVTVPTWGNRLAGTRLNPARPNPAVHRTELSFTIDSAQQVQLQIHDVRGRVVRQLAAGRYEAGEHQVPWNGRDDAGRVVAAGVYFVRMSGTGFATSQPVVFLGR